MAAETVPGFTPEQSWALRRLIAEAVAEGIAAAREEECTQHCTRVEGLQHTVYGNGSTGLKSRLDRLEEQVGNLVWWHRLLVGAVASSWLGILGLIVSLMKG